MPRIIFQLRKRSHSFGDDEPPGWLTPNIPRPPRSPKQTVILDISIEESDGRFLLKWTGPAPEYSGRFWYEELAYAEHAA